MNGSGPASISDIQRRHVDTYESNPDRIEADAGTERQDRADYEGRFVFELLQNAVDEMDDTDEPRVRFELTDDRLLVANNGTAFSFNDLYALTLTTRTTKAGETTIGHKGRGFTSVLGVTDNPSVYSENVQAQFNREATANLLNDNEEISSERGDELVAEQVPLLCLPHNTTTPSRVHELLNDGFTTVFELPNPHTHTGCRVVFTPPSEIESSVTNASWSRYGSLIRIAGPMWNTGVPSFASNEYPFLNPYSLGDAHR